MQSKNAHQESYLKAAAVCEILWQMQHNSQCGNGSMRTKEFLLTQKIAQYTVNTRLPTHPCP